MPKFQHLIKGPMAPYGPSYRHCVFSNSGFSILIEIVRILKIERSQKAA